MSAVCIGAFWRKFKGSSNKQLLKMYTTIIATPRCACLITKGELCSEHDFVRGNFKLPQLDWNLELPVSAFVRCLERQGLNRV